jgi:hypothetical protein
MPEKKTDKMAPFFVKKAAIMALIFLPIFE